MNVIINNRKIMLQKLGKNSNNDEDDDDNIPRSSSMYTYISKRESERESESTGFLVMDWMC